MPDTQPDFMRQRPAKVRALPYHTGLQYLAALLTTALTTGLLYFVRDEANLTIITLLFLLPVGVSTAVWGLGPGIFAAVLSFLELNYFFILPYHTLEIHEPIDFLAIIIYLGIAIGTGQLLGREQRRRAQAAAQKLEAMRLYELSNRLAGLQDEHEISAIIAEQSLIAIQADRVVMALEMTSSGKPLEVRLPVPPQGDGTEHDTAAADLVIPMVSGQGTIGVISIWREALRIQPAEKQLLYTFASHGVLALERARLAQTDERARILEESDRLKSSLLSSVSHELRTPLATIMAAVTSLRADRQSLDEESQSELLAVIEEETDLLNQLVGNLLNMARIEAGALNPQKQLHHLEDLVESSLVRKRQQVQHHQVRLNIPEDLRPVPVDYFQMEQLLTNLISNCVKYSPPGSRIDITAAADEAWLSVTMTNQGPPVREVDLERIFDKFNRITSVDRVTGAGLGLSICKGIIEAHGGKIWAENRPEGFTYCFTLPLAWEGKLPEELAAREQG